MMPRYRIEKFEVHKSSMYDVDTAEIMIAGDIRVEDMKRIQEFIESIPDGSDFRISVNTPTPWESVYSANSYLIAARGSGKTRYFQDWLFNQYLCIRPTKVIFHDPATIVFWNDCTKTVVKCQEGDTYSKEMGLALCFSKKMLGNQSNFNNIFKKWIPEE